MGDKYYFPKIEEFHVGFEYEQHEVINERDPHWKMMVKKMRFSKKEINQIFYNVDLVDNLDQKRIRVKYLDKEDIESFGFKLFNGEDVFEKYIKKYRGNSNLKCHLIFRESILIMIGDDETPWSDWNVLFTGIINNKNELKKLLIQLQLINE